jgi:opacity protein-like surface antigen
MFYITGGDELMKKIKLIIASAAMLCLTASPAVYADGFAPGEGMYLGAFVGHAAGHVSAKVDATETGGGNNAGGGRDGTTTSTTIEITDGGLAINGMEGGGWVGYGYKMGDLYIGFEGDFAGGGGEFKITSTRALETKQNEISARNLTEASAEMKWSGGAAGRIGYYVNPDTLFTIKAGISAAKFDVKWATDSESFYGGGPRFGAALESRISAIDPNLSIKLAANYVDYMTAPVSGIGTNDHNNSGEVNSEVSGAAYNARLGIQYSFFDVNSLF